MLKKTITHIVVLLFLGAFLAGCITGTKTYTYKVPVPERTQGGPIPTR